MCPQSYVWFACAFLVAGRCSVSAQGDENLAVTYVDAFGHGDQRPEERQSVFHEFERMRERVK